ncbi:double-strand break repair protein AddB [Methylocella silvestris]|uniref:Double-strand break repair protein AddB n=1 Tax=Methylocella silvestris TaxID=199596 RepID=A0A2J7TK66_METSI|nr:double-strand break repair protein AddB [Methylocella silvestris]PNG27156.1 double-strand break repair protein AddB [Methylocella silvestris]
MTKKNVFTIAPGAPFLRTFAGAFLNGDVVEGFCSSENPLELADVTIYVPTRRAARALTDEFTRALPAKAVLLPRILPLGALDESETELLFEDGGANEFSSPLEPPLAIGEIDRRMQLAELCLSWSRLLRHAIVRVGADGARVFDERESLLVGATAADAWGLSGDLARLIDELIIEDIDWGRLDPLGSEGFDDYWRITLDFLQIAVTQWPHILEQRGLVDRARRQVSLIERQSLALREAPRRGPVVAIGSTGSNRATARLLDAIASAPRGAIVLPGLDLKLDEAAFALVARSADEGEPAFTHPQAALCRLLRALNISREEVRPLGALTKAQEARERFISEALRPAEATDAWIAYRQAIDPALLDEALAGVALIEALDEREEALAIAIAMRHALERREGTAALVTPDRELARRVAAELLRWGIRVEDSAGEPLGSSEAGLLARLVAACAAEDMSAASVAALMAHGALRLGFSREEIARLRPLLEIGVLRSAAGAKLRDPAQAIELAAAQADGPHAHPAQKRIFPRESDALRGLLQRLVTALRTMLDAGGERDLGFWVEAHRTALAAIRGGESEVEDWGEDDASLAALFEELALSATPEMRFDAEAYQFFFAAVAGEARLNAPGRTHPRLKILGLLEARLMDADVMLLGGLDESVWPPQARADAFLNRPMRAALGLSPPERKLGQTAHDFVQAMGREKVILSRAAKRGGAPTVASRFIQRLAALGGAAWTACALRGKTYLDLARLIDRPADPQEPLRRPEPRPPVSLRPSRLSVTKIETLRRDPYAIYAETILKLLPLDPIGRTPGPAETGSAIHAAIEAFTVSFGPGPLPAGARETLRALLLKALEDNLADPGFAAFYVPRLEQMIDFYMGFEASRRGALDEISTEAAGRLDFFLADGSPFALTARADRIERAASGKLSLIDFKTGTPPGIKEIEVGFAPQLTLEAAMAKRGAFGPASIGEIEALYVKLNGPGGGKIKPVAFKQRTLADVADEHFANLLELLSQFRDPDRSYPPRPFPKFAKAYNAYDHLARVKEWSAGGESEDG